LTAIINHNLLDIEMECPPPKRLNLPSLVFHVLAFKDKRTNIIARILVGLALVNAVTFITAAVCALYYSFHQSTKSRDFGCFKHEKSSGDN
jgi:hypothetical protein